MHKYSFHWMKSLGVLQFTWTSLWNSYIREEREKYLIRKSPGSAGCICSFSTKNTLDIAKRNWISFFACTSPRFMCVPELLRGKPIYFAQRKIPREKHYFNTELCHVYRGQTMGGPKKSWVGAHAPLKFLKSFVILKILFRNIWIHSTMDPLKLCAPTKFFFWVCPWVRRQTDFSEKTLCACISKYI
jgi:hypothetical protein